MKCHCVRLETGAKARGIEVKCRHTARTWPVRQLRWVSVWCFSYCTRMLSRSCMEQCRLGCVLFEIRWPVRHADLATGRDHALGEHLFVRKKNTHVSISSSERAFVAFYVSFCCLILYSTRKGEQVIRVCMGIMLHPRSNSINTSPTACNFGLPASETRKWQPATSIQCSCGNLTAHCQPVRRLLG